MSYAFPFTQISDRFIAALNIFSRTVLKQKCCACQIIWVLLTHKISRTTPNEYLLVCRENLLHYPGTKLIIRWWRHQFHVGVSLWYKYRLVALIRLSSQFGTVSSRSHFKQAHFRIISLRYHFVVLIFSTVSFRYENVCFEHCSAAKFRTTTPYSISCRTGVHDEMSVDSIDRQARMHPTELCCITYIYNIYRYMVDKF